MGLQLPGELISVLGMLGYTWPEADETKLVEMGQAWIDFSATLQGLVGEAAADAATVWSGSRGTDIDAFQRWWSGEEGPAANLTDGATAAVLTGTGLIICGMIVLALKVAIIVQLVVLAIQIAQAVATAAPTFGASLLEIPIFQQISRMIVGNLIEEVLMTLAAG